MISAGGIPAHFPLDQILEAKLGGDDDEVRQGRGISEDPEIPGPQKAGDDHEKQDAQTLGRHLDGDQQQTVADESS